MSALRRHRHKLLPAASLVILAVASIVYRDPLGAWFFVPPRAGAPAVAAATPAQAAPSTAEAPTAESPIAALELSAEALREAQRGLELYDRVRALLAADRLDGLAPAASSLIGALDVLERAAAAPSLQPALRAARADLELLARAQSLEVARTAFKSSSRLFVELATADGRLRDGWRVFSCPMTDGYARWMQREPVMANPYMGLAMLQCGSPAPFDTPPPPDRASVSHEGHGHAGGDIAFFTCPMHPSVRQPGQTPCPLCGMDLTPVSFDEMESGVVLVDEVRRQRIGLRTEAIAEAPLTVRIRAPGRLTFDETEVVDVSPRIGGWIVTLDANVTGQLVKKGQVLYTLYSPELRAAQEELLLAAEGLERSRGSAGEGRAAQLLEAARRRLSLWEVSEAVVRRIEAERRVLDEVPFHAPKGGHLVIKEAIQGASVAPGQRLFRIASLGRIWVEADLYEADLPHVKLGDRAFVSLPHMPGQRLAGTVSFVAPYLDPTTRTAKARVTLPNPDLELKPEMYADVELTRDLGPRLQVPASAVIFTGPRRLVFLDLGEGRLMPQEVTLGARDGDRYEVLSGLKAGHLVVTSGNFLVASESRIRSASEHWGSHDAH